MKEPGFSNRGINLPVDVIRTAAIALVILLHAATREIIPVNNIMSTSVVVRWWSTTVYNSIAAPCIPLFVMLTGALLLQPYKVEEPLGVFFKKRLWRIGLPFLFWGLVYFVWSVSPYSVYPVPLTLQSVGAALAAGPYYQFWYLYMLFGLYLVTPIFRVVVASADRRLLRYFVVLWFTGVGVVPLLQLFTGYALNSTVFVIAGFIGYYVLGLYLLDVQLRSRVLYGLLALGFAWTIAGTYFVSYFIGGETQYFFYNYTSVNVILASVAMFLLLSRVGTGFLAKRPTLVGTETRFTTNFVGGLSYSWNRVVSFVSRSSLAIFMLHVIVLESLWNGYFGVKVNILTLYPPAEIPLVTVLTLLICLALLYPASRVSILRKMFGIIS